MNKDEYRARRARGLRGQGSKPSMIIARHDKPDWPPKEVTKKAKLKNSRRARRENSLA